MKRDLLERLKSSLNPFFFFIKCYFTRRSKKINNNKMWRKYFDIPYQSNDSESFYLTIRLFIGLLKTNISSMPF